MTGRQFGWRAGLLALVVASFAFAAFGWVLTQFDSQYADAGIAGRSLVGVVGGALAAVVALPVSLAVGVVIGAVAGMRHRSRVHHGTVQ